MASSGEPPDDPLNSSFCLLPPSYFNVPEPRELRAELPPQPNVTEAINSAIGQQFERMAHLSRQLEQEREHLAERKLEVKTLQRKVADTEAAAAKRLANVCADYEHRLSVHETLARDALSRFEEERESMMRRANEEEELLNKELAEARASLESAQEANAEVTLKLHDSSEALERSRKEVERLSTFQRWEQDRWEVLERCTQLEERVAATEATSGLKQQRLDALQTILALQEAELARHGTGEDLEALKGLVGRWREKVFALMVQAEAARQTAAQERRQGAYDRAEAARDLDRSRGLVAQLELKLSAAQAELDEERSRLQQVTLKLRYSEASTAAALKDCEAWRSAVDGLRGSVEAVVAAVAAQERQFAARALGPLAASERRLETLAERLPVLKAQLKRLRAREALEQARSEFESRETELRRELAVVREDRDRLAHHVEQDAEERESSERDVRGRYEAEIVTLERTSETLRLELAVKTDSLERIEEERNTLNTTCEMLQEDQRRLQEEIAGLEAARESAVGAATAGLFSEHMQQMSEMQTALDEARREHAKAVLSQRQTERELERSLADRATEEAALEERWRRREADFEAELARVTAEANLLRATVRQEGLLRAHGDARPAPRMVDFAEEVEETGAAGSSGSPHKAPEEFQPHLVNLIEEVRSLVRSVETSDLYATDEDDDELS